MNIYIDFDGTLFDTNRFFGDFVSLCKKYGVKESSVYNLRNKSNDLFNLDDLALKIKEAFNLNNTFLDEVDNLYNSKYVYDDVISFLEKYSKKYNLIIYTYGEKKYQTKKINCAKIKKYFSKVIISNNKSSEDLDYANSWFIDNNPKELEKLALVGATKLIRLKRDKDPRNSLKCLAKAYELFALSDIDML